MFSVLGILTVLFKIGSFIAKFKWIVPMMYLAYVVYLSWKKKVLFDKQIHNLRKVWYLILIFAFGIDFIANGFQAKEWQTILLYVSIFVFGDLAVFQTPTISKLWGAEFSNLQKIEDNTNELEKQANIGDARGGLYVELVEQIDDSLLKQIDMSTFALYQDSFETFIDSYCDVIGSQVDTFDGSDVQAFSTRFYHKYGIRLTDEQLDDLKIEGKMVLLNAKQVLYFSNKVFPIITFVSSEKNTIHSTDLVNLYSMTLIHTWFKK